ncbi:MAG: multidrug transporter subunit MdtN [Bradyrhizobium sp.]
MKATGHKRRIGLNVLLSLAVIGSAIAVGLYIDHRVSSYPASDDATIDADIVHIASTVAGRVMEIPVSENALVKKGDLLFRIDPLPYELTLAQTEADLAIAQAGLDTKRRAVSTQQSAASIASDQTKRAQTNYELSTRTVERLRPLATKGYVPAQQLDQAEVAERDATTSLQQAKEQEAAAIGAIDTIEGAEAAVRARRAAVAIARRALDDTSVRAPNNGRVVGLNVLAGEVVAPSQSLFTLINTDEWFAVVNFRETALRAIAVDECATVFSMIDRTTPIRGKVVSIGWGVLDTGKINLPRSVPFVEQSLNWVRVAQRFPVRVRLENPPELLVRVGASAVVEVGRGSGCR